MSRISQSLNNLRFDDIEGEISQQLKGYNLDQRVKPGDKVCIGVGSRGISNMDRVIRQLVVELKDRGAEPFLIPAMGSHGGATAEGQLRVLHSYGITEESMGCPIHSSLEVELVGRTREGTSVYLEKHAARADYIVAVNRIKPHTLFFGEVQSGLQKMLVIGFGKHKGATALHQSTIEYGTDSRLLAGAAKLILETGKVLFGLAIVENGFDQTAKLEVIAPDRIPIREAELLGEAKVLMPHLPVQSLDLLIVDEIGKEISGSGMDPNVVGRKWDDPLGVPRILRIFVRGLSPHTYGNATGIGRADFTTTRLVKSMDRQATYANVLTAMHPEAGRIPVYYDSDREVIDAVLLTLGDKSPDRVRAAWIKNTLKISELLVSQPVLQELQGRQDIKVLDGPVPLDFDQQGNLIRRLFGFEADV